MRVATTRRVFNPGERLEWALVTISRGDYAPNAKVGWRIECRIQEQPDLWDYYRAPFLLSDTHFGDVACTENEPWPEQRAKALEREHIQACAAIFAEQLRQLRRTRTAGMDGDRYSLVKYSTEYFDYRTGGKK